MDFSEVASMTIDGAEVSCIAIDGEIVWTVPSGIPDYLCFTAEEDNSTIVMGKTIGRVYQAPDVTLETSTDGQTWSDWDLSSTITLENAGDKVYLRAGPGGNSRFCNANDMFYPVRNFIMTGKIAASGNIKSLLSADDFEDLQMHINGTFGYIFRNCTSLTQAPELTSTKLANNCYRGMFYNCTSLTAAPELPATTLSDYCYNSMFLSCTSLVSAPELPATTLGANCYSSMFTGCTSLTAAPELPAKSLPQQCYYSIFQGCSGLVDDVTISGITSIGMSSLQYLIKGTGRHLTIDERGVTAVPFLYSATQFSDIGDSDYVILVPPSLYDEWIEDTNWTVISNHISAAT